MKERSCQILPGSSLCIICATQRQSEGHGCLWKYLWELLPGGERSEKLLHMDGIQKQLMFISPARLILTEILGSSSGLSLRCWRQRL